MKHVLVTALLFVAVARADDVAIVVGKSVPIDNLSSAELGHIFRCEETTVGGTKITVYNREKGSVERGAVLRLIYHMNDSAYSRFFMQAVFTGAITEGPKIAAGAAAAKQAVAGTPGAISYVLASQVDGSVKIVKVDGQAPGDAGYPLKAGG